MRINVLKEIYFQLLFFLFFCQLSWTVSIHFYIFLISFSVPLSVKWIKRFTKNRRISKHCYTNNSSSLAETKSLKIKILFYSFVIYRATDIIQLQLETKEKDFKNHPFSVSPLRGERNEKKKKYICSRWTRGIINNNPLTLLLQRMSDHGEREQRSG